MTAIDPEARRVETDAGGFDYDHLIVSLRAELRRHGELSGWSPLGAGKCAHGA